MALITRRAGLAAAGTLAAGLALGKWRSGYADPDSLPALKLLDPPVEAPEIVFLDDEDGEHRLGDFRGHAMVVNFWATWCMPCVEEMPSLAALARAVAPDDIAVLPLSSDRAGAPRVRQFFADHAIAGLPILLDPKGAAIRSFGVAGLPTTVIIDKQGRERARLEGGADWSTEAAIRTVRSLAT